MRSRAIHHKEWLKLKWFLPALATVAVAAALHFWFELDLAFASIEPESMLWYRFAQLEDKPYSYLAPFFLLSGTVIALCQFLPEALQNRVRILTHLPVPLRSLVRHHLVAGAAAVLAVNSLTGLLLALIMSFYYPPEVVFIAVKDSLFWLLPSLTLYLGLCSVIIERSLWRKWLKLLPTVLIVLLFYKNRYSSGDLLLLAVILWLLPAVYDSFLSVKTLRLKTLPYRGGALLVGILILLSGMARYQQDVAKEFKKYYLFYSPVLEAFVYQKNGRGHQFEYGTTETTFNRETYEDALPFVYWKNRDIQGRLPVTIAGETYDKENIRKARLSLQYQPASLATGEVQLYPLFNPHSDKGAIPFPEEAFVLKKDRILVYDCESVEVVPELSGQINSLLADAGVAFPLTGIWGKTTNMKPFDWGYFIKDQKGRIFNLSRADNDLAVKQVPLPRQLAPIVYIQVSENRQKNFYGYLITANSRIFLISYPDYELIPLQLEGFDYRKMSFQLLADPLHYLVRFDDDKSYHAVLFDKDYQLIKAIKIL